MSGEQPRARGVITERDLEWLAWVGRWRGVTAPQIGAWFLPDTASRVQIAEARARVWLSHGLTRADAVLAGVPRLHNLRSAGMRAADVSGPTRRVSVGTCRHDLAVVDLATVWHHRGRKIVTEREIRAAEPLRGSEAVMSVETEEGAGRARTYPDLLTVHSNSTPERPRFAAHEVELAPKTTNRLLALMRSYGRSEQHVRAIYYVPDSYRRRVEQAAEEANETILDRGWAQKPKIFVQPWIWEG